MPVQPVYNCFHPILKKPTLKVENFDGELKTFIDNLSETLHFIKNGVGLAANQIGGSKSVVIVDLAKDEDYREFKSIIMINPEILSYSEETIEDTEGCLSVPEFYEKVVRPRDIQVRYYDINEKEYIEEATGFMARVMQHEIDHLHGILFYEKLTPLRRALAKSKLKKIQRGEIPTEYPMVLPDGRRTE